MRALFLIAFIAIFFSSCVTTISFTPIPCSQFTNCQETIHKTLLKQSPVPKMVDVTDKLMSWDYGTYYHDSWSSTTQQRYFTFFFEDIYDMRVVHDNSGRYEIRFRSRTSKNTYIIFLWDKQIAIEGYSAINCMIESTK